MRGIGRSTQCFALAVHQAHANLVGTGGIEQRTSATTDFSKYRDGPSLFKGLADRFNRAAESAITLVPGIYGVVFDFANR